MTDFEAKLFNDLKSKIDQHEITISQLLEIVASTNRRLSDIVEVQDKLVSDSHKQIISS